MKNILLIALFSLIGFSSIAQKDTLTQNSTGYEFEVYRQSIFVTMDNDTVVKAKFLGSKNQLPWGNTPMIFDAQFVMVRDSIKSLLKVSFEGIVSLVGANSFEDEYGIYTLNAVNVNYSIDSIASITCLYNKQLKAPNGSLTEIFISYNKILTPEQVVAFEQLLLSTEVKAMYTNWYNEILGNI